MPTLELVRSIPIDRTSRVMQVEGLFDLAPSLASSVTWSAHVPLEEHPWQIGLIVGPSGSGKSTLARELFGDEAFADFQWPREKSIVDAFPVDMNIREVTGLLSRVGFSSPPAWLRPFQVLSTGEQFRVTLARALAEARGKERTVVIDEFTSVVDRTVARIGSAAVAKAIRVASGKTEDGKRRTEERSLSSDFRPPPSARLNSPKSALRFVAVSCHDDIIDWLDPDWIYAPATDDLRWRLERRRRPDVHLEIGRVRRSAWRLFKHHHYLSGDLHKAAKCFIAFVEGRPAAFAAVLSHPHPRRPGWREHRLVCLPDYQGIGIGNALSEFIASLFAATGKPYYSTTSHPAMIRHRLRSPLWTLSRRPGLRRRNQIGKWKPTTRMTAGFRFIGPSHPREAAFRMIGQAP